MMNKNDFDYEEIIKELMGEDYIPPDKDEEYNSDSDSGGDLLSEFADMRDEYKELFSNDVNEIKEDYRRLMEDYKEYTEACGDNMADDPEFIRNGIAMDNVRKLMSMFLGMDTSLKNLLNSAGGLVEGDFPAMEIHCETPKQINDKYRVGDHLRINRGIYTHHGLYVGNGHIIHYSQGYDDIPEIREVPFAKFAGISKIDIVPENESPMIFPREVVAERARSRLGEKQYNLVFNNCETFVRWCRAGG